MRFLRDALITIAVLVAVAAIAFVSLKGNALSAEAEPSRFEASVARRLVRLSIPDDAGRLKNASAPDAWRDAVAHFQDHCAVCHGMDGRGQTDVGRNMYPKVPDLSSAPVQQMSDGELFYVIQNGVRWTGMPSWKREHSPEDTWKLVSFIRKVPTLTTDDLMTSPDSDHHDHHDHHDHEHHAGRGR